MIGTLNHHDKRATIIGAGVSGLIIGYALKKKGFEVKILERSSRVGGLIETKQTPFGPAETAAHSLLVTPEMKTYFDELGVTLTPVNAKSKARYIYRNGKMRRFPLTIIETLRTLIRFLSRPTIAPTNLERLTLAEWCLVYLGHPALRFLLSPFVSGVFATTPEELNLKISFPMLYPKNPELSFFSQLRELRKNKKPRPQMMAPVSGMQDLVQKLAAHLHENIELNTKIDSLPESPNLILSVPAPELARLIATQDPSSAQLLQKVTHSPLVTISLFYPRSAFQKNPPRGVGVLIPKDQGLRTLGVLFNSSSFPNRTSNPETISLTAMLGGTQDPSAVDLTDAEIKNILERDLQKLFSTSATPLHLEITRWKKAIPIYSEQLLHAQESLARGFCKFPGRIIFTNYSREVSIRGIINASLNL